MLSTLILSVVLGTATGPIPVKVVLTNSGFQLRREGKPYFIRGGGCSDTTGPWLDGLKAAGGNSVRTWGADGAEALLDAAQARGMTVMIGIWLGHTEHGMKWNDPKMVADQIADVKKWVLKYKNHPAVLAWALGNEMEGGADQPKLWSAVNEMAVWIKRVDPDHPVLTVVAEMNQEKADAIKKYAPALDFLGINSYGGLATLPKRLKEYGVTTPYAITEFGTPGPWESAKTPWGVPIEKTSTAKAADYRSNYLTSISGNPAQCLGSYAFIWGTKQEETATWFGTHLPSGENLGAVEELTELWTGHYPKNRVPVITKLAMVSLDTVAPEGVMRAEIQASDPDSDDLTYEWGMETAVVEKNAEGVVESSFRILTTTTLPDGRHQVTLKAPHTPGFYRLMVKVLDGHNNAACGNIAFQVK